MGSQYQHLALRVALAAPAIGACRSAAALSPNRRRPSYGPSPWSSRRFAWGTHSAYHAGVEWGFWPGPTACTGVGTGISFDQLNDINAARVVPCDVVQFRFLGISLAGYNALISAAIVALLLVALVDGWRRRRATLPRT